MEGSETNRQERIQQRVEARANRARRRAERAQRRLAAAEQLRIATEEATTLTPFRDINGVPLNLRGLFRGASCFLILSGLSITELNLSLLDQRGIATLGINNSPAIYRPNIWTYSDRPDKFHNATWLDPYVIKSVVQSPQSHYAKWPLHRKLLSGEFEIMTWPDGTPQFPRDMPGVVGHVRNSNFDPANWLSEPSINRGNSIKSANLNGYPHCLNTMFTAIKTAYAFGFRIVYLLGCDFTMSYDQPYAFAQDKGAGGVNGNNASYYKMRTMFAALKPHFDAAGFHVFNCNPRSRLTVFDFVSYDEAIRAATQHVPQDPLDTTGWYELDEQRHQQQHQQQHTESD